MKNSSTLIVLETERMILRQMDMDDVENLQRIFSDPEAMRYYPKTKSLEETEEWISWNVASYRLWGFGLWIAMLKDSQAFAGQCGLVMQRVNDLPEVEVGYLFVRKYWNRGLATEAAKACRDYGINKLEYERLISLIDPRNAASIRVAEKIGMAFEKEVVHLNKRISLYSLNAADIICTNSSLQA
jgi:RimJ/RimL family protein N-acetyltransferase